MSVIRRQRCTGCEVVKAHTLRNFYRCKTGKYGLRIKCKDCVKQDIYENRELKRLYYRAYYRRRNREAVRRAVIRAWMRTPAGRECSRRSRRAYVRFKALERRA